MSENIYIEPSNLDYIIIKTKDEMIAERGSLYEATRKAWYAKLETAKPYKYVLSVVQGEVREVYEVEEWKMSDEPGCEDRIQFIGHVAPKHIKDWFIGKMIPEKYRVKGLASPFLYKKLVAGEETKEMTLQVPVAPVPEPEEDEEDQIVINGIQYEIDDDEASAYFENEDGRSAIRIPDTIDYQGNKYPVTLVELFVGTAKSLELGKNVKYIIGGKNELCKLTSVVVHSPRGFLESGMDDFDCLTFFTVPIQYVPYSQGASATPESRPQPAPSKKKFRKYPDEGKISGVCYGLAEYWGMSVTLVRIIFLVLFMFGIGLWIYIILALAMPRE